MSEKENITSWKSNVLLIGPFLINNQNFAKF